MGLKPKAPQYPDPGQTAGTQYQYNKQAAADTAAGANKAGPFGATTTQYGADGLPTGQTATLSSELQPGAENVTGNLNAQTGLLPTAAFNANVDANGIRNAYIDNATLAAQPEWSRQDKQNEVRLAERGIPIGSEVWGDVQNQVGEQRNAYMRGAANDAYIAGTQEEQRQRNNALQDYLLPYQTAASGLGLLGGYQGFVPGYSSLPSVNAPDFAGQVANKYNADYKNYQDQISGLGSLASTGLGLLTAPLTGPTGIGNSIIGRGVSNLFNIA